MAFVARGETMLPPVRDATIAAVARELQYRSARMRQTFLDENGNLFWACVELHARVARTSGMIYAAPFLDGAVMSHEIFLREYRRSHVCLPRVDNSTIDALLEGYADAVEPARRRPGKTVVMMTGPGTLASLGDYFLAGKTLVTDAIYRQSVIPPRQRVVAMRNVYKERYGPALHREMGR